MSRRGGGFGWSTCTRDVGGGGSAETDTVPGMWCCISAALTADAIDICIAAGMIGA